MAVSLQIIYPASRGTRFDHDYYLGTHLPLVDSHMGAHIDRVLVTKGIAGGPDVPPTQALKQAPYCRHCRRVGLPCCAGPPTEVAATASAIVVLKAPFHAVHRCRRSRSYPAGLKNTASHTVIPSGRVWLTRCRQWAGM